MGIVLRTGSRVGRRVRLAPAVAVVVVSLALAAGCSSSGGDKTSPGQKASSPGSSTGATGATNSVAALVPADLKQAGVIKAAALSSFPPQESLDPQTNKLVGVNIDIMDAMGKAMGLKVDYQTVTFDSMIPGLQAKRFDIATIGFLATQQREDVIDLVTIDKSPQSFLVPSNSSLTSSYAAACGVTFALLASNTYADAIKAASSKCEAEGKKPITIQTFPDDNGMFSAVVSGRAGATINGVLANIYQAGKSDGKLKNAPGYLNCSLAGFGIAKGNQALLVALQAAMNEVIKSGQYDEIMKKWNATDVAITTSKISPLAGTYSTEDCSDK